jgi:hypothetical protein
VALWAPEVSPSANRFEQFHGCGAALWTGHVNQRGFGHRATKRERPARPGMLALDGHLELSSAVSPEPGDPMQQRPAFDGICGRGFILVWFGFKPDGVAVRAPEIPLLADHLEKFYVARAALPARCGYCRGFCHRNQKKTDLPGRRWLPSRSQALHAVLRRSRSCALNGDVRRRAAMERPVADGLRSAGALSRGCRT